MIRAFAPKTRVGQLIGGRYELSAVLGEGGQSAVYRARDRRYGDEVAVKILKQSADPQSTERMFREARAMASLQGTAAVRVLDQQWAEDGAMCLITELLDGLPLDDVLDGVEKNGALLDVASVVPLVEPIVRTLAAAHDMGIVHRDLKPANIFVLRHERGVRLLDFGFAKFTRLRGLTMDGMVAGSPNYIAPEAWKGRKDGIDHRIDVYGLGAVIFRCLAGKPPFASASLKELVSAVTSGPRPSLYADRPELGPGIDDWIEHALAANPEERFQNVTALWQAFRHATRA